MGLKQIFQNGMQEFKRQSAYRKEKRNLEKKEKIYSEQLTQLGKKAWESKLDMSGYSNLEELISTTQKHLDELNSHISGLEKQDQNLEGEKKEKEGSFESQIKNIEEKKKEIDFRLNDEKKKLREAEKSSESADSRLKQINREEEQLNTRASDTQTPDSEKTEIKKKLAAFDVERDELSKKQKSNVAEISTLSEKIKPLEGESTKFQQEIDKVRGEEKKVVGDLENSISKIQKEITGSKDKIKGVNEEQDQNFKKWGEKLAEIQVTDQVVAEELATVNTTKQEMGKIEGTVQNLEQQKTAKSRSALWKMIGVITAFLVVIIAVIILLVTVLSPKNKSASPFELLSKNQKVVSKPVAEIIKKVGEDIRKSDDADPDTETGEVTKTPASAEEVQQKLDTMTGKIKEQSEQMQGGKIVTTDKSTFISALPQISGWKTENTTYNKNSFGQIERSFLTTTYVSANGQKIGINITDTATGSAALRTYKLLFNMNMTKEDDKGYEKISKYNDIPVREKYTKDPPRAEFMFIFKDRYIVDLRSRGENCLTLIKEFIPKFDLSRLQ